MERRPQAPENLFAAWGFAWALERGEVIAALEDRLKQIAASREVAQSAWEELRDPGTPLHLVELVRLNQ